MKSKTFMCLLLLMAVMLSGQAYAQCTVLWDQPIAYSALGLASQDFETANDGYDIFSADDFVVPGGQTWTIDRFYVPGTGLMNLATGLTISIYADNAGLPNGYPIYDATVPVWTETYNAGDANVDWGGTTGEVTVDTVTPPSLGAGTYWIIFYPSLDFSYAGQWFWYLSDTTNGYNTVQINPLGGFYLGTTWFAPSTTETDLAFTLWECPAGDDDDDDVADDDDDDVADDDDDDTTGPVCAIGLEEFEGTFPPAGWTVTDLTAYGGETWHRNDYWGDGNYTSGSGYCADANSDVAGYYVEFNTELITPSINLTNYLSASLAFWANFQSIADQDFFLVDISTDAGYSWTNLLLWNEDHPYGSVETTPGEYVTIDLTPYVGGPVLLRFVYLIGGIWQWYAQVDEVCIDGVAIADDDDDDVADDDDDDTVTDDDDDDVSDDDDDDVADDDDDDVVDDDDDMMDDDDDDMMDDDDDMMDDDDDTTPDDDDDDDDVAPDDDDTDDDDDSLPPGSDDDDDDDDECCGC